MSDFATDEVSIARKQAARKRSALLEEQVVRGIMATVDGRKWIWWQLEDANVFSQTFTVGEDGHARNELSAFKEGKRASGLRLLGVVMRAAPADYMTMTRENAARGAELENEND